MKKSNFTFQAFSLIMLPLIIIQCSNSSENQTDRYQILKEYVQDSLNKRFYVDSHVYVLVGSGGCSGCIKKAFHFLRKAEGCQNVTLITNSNYPNTAEKKKIEENVSHYYKDKDYLRVQKLRLETQFTPSFIFVNNGTIKHFSSPTPSEMQRNLEKLPCDR